MTWSEIRKTDDMVIDTKDYLINRMKKHYECVASNEIPTFILPDGSYMRLFVFRNKESDCIGMEYGESPDCFPDDGDLYYLSDFRAPDDMFYAMIEETKR